VTGTNSAANKQDVRKRRVFYISGYDPMLPRRYRELYRSEGAAQAEISNYSIELKGKSGGETYAWSVSSLIDEAKTEATVEFLLWSDIVRRSMTRSIPGTFVLLAQVVWIYVSTGALFRLMRLRKGPIIAALYPVFMLCLQLVIAVALGALVWFGFSQIIPSAAAVIIAVAVFVWLLLWFRRIDNRLFVYYLLHDYAFSTRFRGRTPPELDQRMAEFGARISDALDSDVDEVLVVGHSSGAHLAVGILADLLRRQKPSTTGPKLAFLSLGQVVPMVSFLPEANDLRRDLNYLSTQQCLTWVDVTAPGDGCSFALCDPVGVSGAAPDEGQIWPLVISAAFSLSLSPERFKALKRRYFRLHFQYLCAFDRPLEYDYFQITAGPLSLARRYKDQAPSPSRISRPLSGFRYKDTL